MNFLNPKLIIVIVLLLLILAASVFLKIQLSSQKEPAPDIQTFKKTSPLPTPLIPYEQLPEEEKMRLQTIADEYYAKAQEDILKLYPWYNTFPIKAQNYFVYFDLDKKEFIALLYPQKSSSISIDTQIEDFKKEINELLRAIDPKTLDLPIKWEIKPE